MYSQGQLVQNTADGSRPGYQGPKRRVLGEPIKIDEKEYKKVLEGSDKGKYAIKEGTNNPRQFVNKSEIRKTVKSNSEIGQAHLRKAYEERSKLYTLGSKNRNKFVKNWIKNNVDKYGVREFDKFQNDLLKVFNNEVKNNPKKYTGFGDQVMVYDDLPVIGDAHGRNTIEIDGIKFPRYSLSGRTQKYTYKKVFYKNKLKDKNFKAKVNTYLDWNLTKKRAGGAGSAGTMSATQALDYGKLVKGLDDDVVYFMGEVLNDRPLNPGGGQIGIHDIFRGALGKKGDAYFKKYQGSWDRWRQNFDDVAKLAGLDQSQTKALMQKQINDTQKIMKVYNVKKLPLEFMVAQDHIMGLAEAKALGDPKIAAQTLRNLVASTKEQNRYLGQQGFSTKRKALINKFKKAPSNARGPIIEKLNTLADEFVPGRLKYDVGKDGSLKITNLQPETTLKAKKGAYEKIAKTFPKNIQNLLNIKSGDNAATITSKIKKAPIPNKVKGALMGIVGAYGTITGADFLKKSGILFDQEFEQTASAVDAPIVEKGLGTAEKAAIGTGAALGVGTKVGRKAIGTAFNLGLGPTGMAGLTYAFKPEGGYDLSKAEDRIGFEAEAALAPTIVKGAQSVTEKIKNPLLRKGLEYASGIRLPGISPANMLRAARVASPIGLLSLAGEGLYHSGKKEMARRAELSPQELADFHLERQSRGWAGKKGIMGLKKKKW